MEENRIVHTAGSIDCFISGYSILELKFYTALMTNMTPQAQTQRISAWTGWKKAHLVGRRCVKDFISDKCVILGMAQVSCVHWWHYWYNSSECQVALWDKWGTTSHWLNFIKCLLVINAAQQARTQLSIVCWWMTNVVQIMLQCWKMWQCRHETKCHVCTGDKCGTAGTESGVKWLCWRQM
jgi:hypothetical protein